MNLDNAKLVFMALSFNMLPADCGPSFVSYLGIHAAGHRLTGVGVVAATKSLKYDVGGLEIDIRLVK